MDKVTRKDVECVTTELIHSAQIAHTTVKNRPLLKNVEPLQDTFFEDPQKIIDAFNSVKVCPSSTEELYERSDLQLPEELKSTVGSMLSFCEGVWQCERSRFDPPVLPAGIEELLRHHTAKRVGHRYVVQDLVQRRIYAFQTAHEVAGWWVNQVAVFSKYILRPQETVVGWAAREPSSQIASWLLAAEDSATLAEIDFVYLGELIHGESNAAIAAIEGRHPWRRDSSEMNEWLTEPLEGLDISETLPIFINDDGYPQCVLPGGLSLTEAAGETASATRPRTRTAINPNDRKQERRLPAVQPQQTGGGSQEHDAPDVGTMGWKERRKCKGESINEQLMALYLQDERFHGLTSSVLAKVLDCSARAIRNCEAYKAATADAEHRRQTGRI